MKTNKNKPGRSSCLLLCLVAAGIILAPIGMRGAWDYTNRSEFCVTCHTMDEEFQRWTRSSHREWAGCGDCHVPQKNIVAKIAGKARDGVYHGYAYALDKAPDPIRISRHGVDTVMGNCVRCHKDLVSAVHHDGRKCWDCHRGLPHGY